MPTVFFPPQMRDLTGGAAQAVVEGGNVRDVLRALDQDFPGLFARVVVGEAVAPGLSVSIDGSMTTRLLTKVGPNSEVHFLPAIGGG